MSEYYGFWVRLSLLNSHHCPASFPLLLFRWIGDRQFNSNGRGQFSQLDLEMGRYVLLKVLFWLNSESDILLKFTLIEFRVGCLIKALLWLYSESDISHALQRLTEPVAYTLPSLGTVVTKATSKLQIRPEEAPIPADLLNEILLVSPRFLKKTYP